MKKETLVSIILAQCNPSINVDLLVKMAEIGEEGNDMMLMQGGAAHLLRGA